MAEVTTLAEAQYFPDQSGHKGNSLPAQGREKRRWWAPVFHQLVKQLRVSYMHIDEETMETMYLSPMSIILIKRDSISHLILQLVFPQ